MEKLVSNWCKSKPLPESYIFPPETRPGKLLVPICNTIPVIDLSKAEGQNRTDIIQQILKASQEFGFFQVVNHGIPKNLMSESMDVFKEFFEMPAEEKAILYSDDPKKSCRLLTSSPNYDWEEIHVWRDNLRHPCHPLEESIKLWPEKPTRYREVVSTYSIEAKKLGLRILELVSEGLGLESGYFGDKLSEALSISVNHYPTCPDPSLTLGISKHCDPNLITILHQGDVSGLQVFKDGEWIGVEPLHNAIVINIGHQLQVINHGVPEKLMNDTMSVLKEFFELPAEDKASLYSEDVQKSCRPYTSGLDYSKEKAHLWRDSLSHACHPLEECMKFCPEKPTSYREVVATYSVEAKKLGLRILELLSAGLGLESGYFGSKLSRA